MNDGGGEGGVKRGESMEELKALIWEKTKELKNVSMKTLILNMKSSVDIYGMRRNITVLRFNRSCTRCVFKGF